MQKTYIENHRTKKVKVNNGELPTGVTNTSLANSATSSANPSTGR